MSPIYDLIQAKSENGFVFKPSNAWYKAIGISKKRFWKILKNEESPTLHELKIICDKFGFDMIKITSKLH